MTEPPPPGTVRQAGDVEMLPIPGGRFPLPTTYWTSNGLVPSDLDVLNPSYSISMGNNAQVHFLQECFDLNTIRIWAAFVEQPDNDLLSEFVELFPYAEFPTSDCGNFVANFPDIGNRFVFAYGPPRRITAFLPSVALGTLELSDPQYKKLFR